MLVLSPLRSSNAEEREAVEGFSDAFLGDDFLDSIDFSGIFEGFGVEGDLLPELEVTESHDNILPVFSEGGGEQEQVSEESREELTCVTMQPARMPESRRTTAKGSHGKKKVKVDWTPELHRRFVQAVEQLGVDKAVPSRILDIMGIQNLTRHNVASHLQKYRCQRKHLLAREVEAASWSQRQQIYAVRAGDSNAKSLIKKENNPWIPPTIGFPTPSLQPVQFRPLHVWGHPTVDRTPMVQGRWPGHPVPLHSPAPASMAFSPTKLLCLLATSLPRRLL